jgi:hypothetical protein
MIHTITAHGRCSDAFTFSPVVFLSFLLFLSAYLLLSGVLYEPR